MPTLRNIITIVTLSLLISCNGSTSNETETTQPDNISGDNPNSDKGGNKPPAVIEDGNDTDGFTSIKFKELSIFIEPFNSNGNSNIKVDIKKDTATLSPKPGEVIEGKSFLITTDQLSEVTAQQRYETSITIMNEGAHCDLRDWTHYYSDLKKLPTNSKGQYTLVKYSEAESKKFPEIAIEDLKKKVREQCGAEYSDRIENIKSTAEYPVAVSISRYFLRISGKRKENGQTVSKWIVIEKPMGD